MKAFITVIVLLAVAVGGWYGWSKWRPKQQATSWRTRTIERGEIVQEVRATGTVQPIKNILVGTQVNGPILKLSADFNDEVKEGQVIAQIDPAVYEANVARDEATLASAEASVLSATANNGQARANVEQTQARLDLAEKELVRAKQLRAEEMVSQASYDIALADRDALLAQIKINRNAVDQTAAAIDQAKAAVMQADAALKVSRANLGYTTIASPVDGIIIERNVDEGQTVVSSMNAQTIFTIATDLTRIQLQADIPESDVGGIVAGQPVTFTVDAHSRIVFTGAVTQVRMSATAVQNVVTFPVIIEAANPRKLLFPGMTANLAIETGRAQDVLKIPAAALRFTPPETAVGSRGQGVQGSSADAPPLSPDPRPTSTPSTPSDRRGGGGRIWIVGEDGDPEPVRVRQKLSDGTSIEVETEQDIEGREVILGINSASNASATADKNPFAPQMPGPQMRRAIR